MTPRARNDDEEQELEPWEMEDESSEAAGDRPRSRWKLVVFVLAVLVAGSSPLWSPLVLRQLAFFRVRRVEIVGARYIPPRDILRRLHVDTSASVWDPTAPLAARVATHPAVLAARVRRRLPGTLVVEVTERTPVALVPGPDGFQVVDARGVVLPIAPEQVPVDVPVVVQRDTSVFRLLGGVAHDAPPIFRRLSEVRRVGADELLFQLDTVPVRTRADVTPQRLWDIQPVEQDLARRRNTFSRLVELDLRFRDQVIARVQ